MSSDNPVGDFLRARRALVKPEDVGVRVTGVRRVDGLRREEVAMLAGISTDYYLRLEQGRDRHPSIQVLEAIAHVLQLDDVSTAYLLEIATPKPRRTRRVPREDVPTGLRQMLDVINLPAFIEGRYFDVLAANDLAVALSPNLQPGENRMRAVFLDEAERALYPEWEAATVRLVAGFRESVGAEIDDPRFVQLVGELSIASERFRTLWARHDVKCREGVSVRINHPQVGELTLGREKLQVGGIHGMILVVYHAHPGTESAEKLAMLAALSDPPVQHPHQPGAVDAER
ncbi:helix-turn-helix domain-containing protein [Aeromicrobium chenweiae]|uniref:Transcriptional regulator n=1 Tax=Aeromicrobium chenweiae TaxID=2079793 RepID=A0A2S0WM68_9ACTN|nr:helix-turn-helix transcriptional regulator [Aeromicrobium chenweiae]AWB92415.1 transcriptional regulator [Aeromicrobium chenweiae]TGN31297.1 XRE family transcriptional regulator [Aeromicrobium chenweiae]